MSIVTIICSIPMSIAAEETLSNAKEVQEDPIVAESFEYSDPNLDWQGLPIDSKASLGTETGSATRATAVTGEITPGVYSFEQAFNTGFWIDTRNDSYNSGAYIQQYTYASNPAETDVFSRGGLFKISKHPDTGTYIIRSMLNNRYTFTMYTGSNGKKYIQNQSIPLDDSAVDPSKTFDITYNSGSYTIKLHNTSYAITSCHTTASGASGGTDSYLQFTTAQTDKTKWKMYKYSGSLKVGYVFERPASWTSTGLINDTYYNPRLITWCTQLNYNKPYIVPVYGYSDMLDPNWNIDTARFTMTTKFPGELKLNVGVEFSNSANNTLDIQTLTYRIVPQAGDYYIQNASTEKYIYTSGTSASTSSNPLQYQYNQNFPLMQWEIQHVTNSGGYVRIKSKGGNVYLGINKILNSNNTYEYDVVLSSTLNDYTLWKIDVTSRKTLVFKCKAIENTGYAMYAPNSTNGAAIQQTTYVNNTNLSDEWHIVKKVISVVNLYDEYFDEFNSIQSAVSFANLVFARYLNIGIYFDGLPSLYNLSSGNPVCQKDENDDCDDACLANEDSNCNSHHKNLHRIWLELKNGRRENDHIYVLWSDREDNTFCEMKNNAHNTIYNILAMVRYFPSESDLPKSVIQVIQLSEESQEQELVNKLNRMSIVLVHEMIHCLGRHDIEHYYGDCIMVTDYNQISDSFFNNILNMTNDPFCQSCMSDIKLNYSNATIEGNIK